MKPPQKPSLDELLRENLELRTQLEECQETLRAIREGEVDAVIVTGSKGEQVFSLVSEDSVYRLIVETMKEAAFTLAFDGSILYCNAQFGDFVKRPLDKIIGRPLAEFVAPVDAAAARSLLHDVRGEPTKRRLVLMDSEKRLVPVHISASLLNQPESVSICVVATDLRELENSTELIQQLRRQQEALRDSESRFKAVFLSSQDALLIADNNAVYTEANPAAALILGLPVEEIIGSHVAKFALKDYDFAPVWRRFVQDGCAAYETKLLRGDGEIRDIECTWVANIQPGRHLSVVRDITDRKRNQEELIKTARELERSNSDLEQFAYAASHDLQEPLRMVSGFLNLLSQRYGPKLDKEAGEYIAFAVDGAIRMRRMITDLLAYSRVGTKGWKPTMIDSGDVIEYAKANLRAQIEETNATIEHQNLPMVFADAAQMHQLFQNLIGNALKFRHPDRRAVVRISAKKEDSEWVFSVADNGIGMDPLQTDRIFMLFQRLHQRGKYEGSGIGLAMCKKIVERHGGRIWATSAPGEGTTISFTIPESQER
jgi:PAS domain S-box-containing protein